jgi:hypothetical protein
MKLSSHAAFALQKTSISKMNTSSCNVNLNPQLGHENDYFQTDFGRLAGHQERGML